VDQSPTNVTSLEPATPTAVKNTTKSAIFLEHHLGALVGATAAMIAEAAGEYENGGLSSEVRGRGGELLWELFKLRNFMIADWPNFYHIAKKRGVEALQAYDVVNPATANMLVDAALAILDKIVRDEAN